jgi:hypothetical protein
MISQAIYASEEWWQEWYKAHGLDPNNPDNALPKISPAIYAPQEWWDEWLKDNPKAGENPNYPMPMIEDRPHPDHELPVDPDVDPEFGVPAPNPDGAYEAASDIEY